MVACGRPLTHFLSPSSLLLLARSYSIEQALAHPWTSGEATSDAPIDKTVVKSMMAFNARNKFKKEALKLIARCVFMFVYV